MPPNYPTPSDLKSCRRGAEWAAVVAAAQDVGLFSALLQGARDVPALAAELSLERRPLEIVIGVLEALRLIQAGEGRVELTAEGRARYADPDSDSYEGVAARRWRDGLRRWLWLDETLRTGQAPPEDGPAAREGDEEEADEEEALACFMAAMASKSAQQVDRVVELCLRRRPRARTVLDLGGGPGRHSRAFAARGLRATLYDRPETIEHVAEAYGLEDAQDIELVGGDFLDSLPSGSYDIVLLANITHIYDGETNRRLIARLAGLQRAGDLLAIMDFVRGVSPFAPLFAVTMLLNTEAGNTYDIDAYAGWLSGAGYGELELDSVDEDRQLITARREG